MPTLLYTNHQAAEATGLKESTVKSYCKHLERDVDYIVHERMVAGPAGARYKRQQRFFTESGVQKLCYRRFGRLYERRRSRLQPPPQ